MKLTAYSNFSLRILMVAAMRAPALTTVQEVAAGFAISRAHLVKCVHNLGRWGYIVTLRGNRGGFRLARAAETISVGEVVRRTEEGFDLVTCFDPASTSCPLRENCRLKVALTRARDAFLDVLDKTTLADVTANAGELLRILELEGPPRSDRCECMMDTPPA